MKKNVLSLLDDNGEIAAAFYSVRREGDKLIFDTKALDVMRVDMIVTPAEALKAVKIVFSWPVISFVLLLPYFLIRKKPAENKNK